MLNEQKIRVFLSLANTLNFTETANQLFITQQAVSKHISQLEQELGFALFVRSTHSVKLTAAGERCRVFFSDEMQRLSDFLRSEQEAQRRMSKALRIGYNNWLDLGNAIGAAREIFHGEHPDIAHIPERQPPDLLQVKLSENELDIILVLRRFLRSESGLHIEELGKFPMSIIINRNNALSEIPPDLGRLSQLPLLINSFQGETMQNAVARARRETALVGLKNEKILVVPNRDSVYTSVETGNGIAISCSFSQVPTDIAMLPTCAADTLVCACLESNRRKLVHRYMEILRQCFARQAEQLGM